MHRWMRFIALALCLQASLAFAGTAVTLYKRPNCGCCEKYIEYLQQNGFTVTAHDSNDLDGVKKRYGSDRIAGCHTALIGGYVVEGHVPVAAINKLLKEKPAIVGISVPGMPMNSPGMGEMKPGTLTVYAIPRGTEKPAVFSVE